MDLLYKGHNIEIYFCSENQLLHCNWIGHQPKEVLMHSGSIILQLLQKKSASKILNNNTRVIGPWTDSSRWTAEEWFPRMAASGLLHFGWILSPDAFAELSARRALPKEVPVNIQLFNCSNHSYGDAVTWLQSQQNKGIWVPDKPIVPTKNISSKNSDL